MYADEWTDKRLEALEKRITRVYRQANKELTATAKAYWDNFEARYQQELKAYHEGKYTEQQFRDWYKAQVARGSHWEKMRDNAAERITQANQTAANYINDDLPGTYAFNHNAEIASAVNAGYASIGMSFEMYDENTVKRLLKDQPDLLPEARINIPKDQKWNKRKITEAVTSAIIQSKHPSQLADALQEVTGMNRTSAVRNARTMTTGAQNGGRQQSYEDLASNGVAVQKQWIATLDSRTRDSHRDLDGEIVDYKDTFSNGLEYPGDRAGDPAEVYNCRCTMRAIFDENRKNRAMSYRGKNADAAYEDGEAIKKTVSKIRETSAEIKKKTKANISAIESDKYREAFNGLLSPKADGVICRMSRKVVKVNDGTTNESYVLIDKNGDKSRFMNAGAHGGTIDTTFLRGKEENSVVLVHNHPLSGTFSRNDIATLNENKELCGMIAAAHDGTVYRISTKGGEKTDDNIFLCYNKIKSNTANEEEIIREIAKKYGWSYKREVCIDR